MLQPGAMGVDRVSPRWREVKSVCGIQRTKGEEEDMVCMLARLRREYSSKSRERRDGRGKRRRCIGGRGSVSARPPVAGPTALNWGLIRDVILQIRNRQSANTVQAPNHVHPPPPSSSSLSHHLQISCLSSRISLVKPPSPSPMSPLPKAALYYSSQSIWASVRMW